MGANNGIVVVMVDVSWDSNQQEHTIACLFDLRYKSMHEGLISEDRSNKATLLLTTPREF